MLHALTDDPYRASYAYIAPHMVTGSHASFQSWKEEEEEEEKEEGLFRADAVNEEDPERDRATQEEEGLFKANAVN